MHASAYKTARQFFEVYVASLVSGTVVDIGSRKAYEGQRTLRELCPQRLDYRGIDLEPGNNVDIILTDPYVFPLADASVDVVVCTSVFEHCDYFWQLFEEILRVLKPGGLLYVNAPANGYVHRYPVDCWRFYPDSGVAMANWGVRRGHDVVLLESFITDQDLSEMVEEIWNDFVAVFAKGPDAAARYPQRMTSLRDDYSCARLEGTHELIRQTTFAGREQGEAARQAMLMEAAAKRLHLYHIAATDEQWQTEAPGLRSLDDRANDRPDWAEYAAMRSFLQSAPLEEDVLYGFLAPRFDSNRFFAPNDLGMFAAGLHDNVDILTFSPEFDQSAAFINVFEQGEHSYPGLMDLARRICKEIYPDCNLDALVNTSANGFLFNFCAAKPLFWRKWLALCEQLWSIAENPNHPCAAVLNSAYPAGDRHVAAKVLIMERLGPMLIAASDDFKVEKFPQSTLSGRFADLPYELFNALDVLKRQILEGRPHARATYADVQRSVLSGAAVEYRAEVKLQMAALGIDLSPSAGYESWWGKAPEQSSQSQVQSDSHGGLLRRIFTRSQ
jgi:SAM-dependent methyltransferase